MVYRLYYTPLEVSYLRLSSSVDYCVDVEENIYDIIEFCHETDSEIDTNLIFMQYQDNKFDMFNFYSNNRQFIKWLKEKYIRNIKYDNTLDCYGGKTLFDFVN